MPNSNPSKFSPKELADIYRELILYFEESSGLENEKLSTRVKGYRRLLEELNLTMNVFATLDELNQAMLPALDFSRNQMSLHDAKKSYLKSIFYHLRNAAAHADISRQKRNNNQVWYVVEHSHKKQLKMRCQIKKNDFWKFITNAKKCKSNIKSAKEKSAGDQA